MSRYRWVVLALGMGAQAAFAAVMLGLPSIGPAVRAEYALSLPAFGAVLGAVVFGAMFFLVPWGALTDRVGERATVSVGVGACAGALLVAAAGGRAALVAGLLLAGAFGAVANVASGSAVSGWFRAEERGMALGLRQAATPLGGAAAAFLLPLIAADAPRRGLVALAVACGVAAAACALGLRRSVSHEGSRGARPLRDRRILRLAFASGLLITAQSGAASFVVVFLHDERGLSAFAAGAVLAAIHVLGIVARIVAGTWSDRRGSRVRPLRRLAGWVAVSWLAVPTLLDAPVGVTVAALTIGGAIASSWNGLSFTAAA